MTDIFGYSWEDIQRAQQGGRLARAVDTSKPAADDRAHLEADRALLAKHGAGGLEALGFFGCIGRLQRAGDI